MQPPFPRQTRFIFPISSLHGPVPRMNNIGLTVRRPDVTTLVLLQMPRLHESAEWSLETERWTECRTDFLEVALVGLQKVSGIANERVEYITLIKEVHSQA